MTTRDEFNTFASSKQTQVPPRGISDAILSQVRRDLNPAALTVASKLMGIHAASAVVTLSVCPQFGFRAFGEGDGLVEVFMIFGHYGCLVACGAFFTGVSLLLVALLLKAEEIRRIRQHRLLALGALTLLSLGFFIMMDAEVILGLAIAWFIGALLGSIATLELGWKLRFGRALG